MKRQVQDWPILKLQKQQMHITFPEYQREKTLWSTEAKAFLIDSIFRDIDIPKLYFNLNDKKEYEVVDGNQRLWAIWDYLNDQYTCSVNGERRKFSSLERAEKEIIENYTLQVTVFHDATDEFLREHFVRLQLGTPLVSGEKLNALTGKMKDFVFDKLVKQQFIKSLGIPKRRFAKETLGAQICINSFGRKRLRTFQRTRWQDLRDFFREYQNPQSTDLEIFSERTAAIMNVLGQLWGSFGERTKQLNNRSYILSIYLLFEELVSGPTPLNNQDKKTFVAFTFKVWQGLREEAKAGIERENKMLYDLQTSLSSAPGEPYQIKARHAILSELYEYFKQHPGQIKKTSE
ncbi:MAG TPA: DUF262 domain-containing protein [Pyrinomonadaceae bacterium]|nr:DUF262 domain-containing protein [Pyrinomonadaceae bacterium]